MQVEAKYCLEDVNADNYFKKDINYLYSHLMKKAFLYTLLILSLTSLGSCQTKKVLIQGESYAEVSGGKIWYHVIGEGNSTPILMLHGGPGGTPLPAFGRLV